MREWSGFVLSVVALAIAIAGTMIQLVRYIEKPCSAAIVCRCQGWQPGMSCDCENPEGDGK